MNRVVVLDSNGVQLFNNATCQWMQKLIQQFARCSTTVLFCY